METRLIRCKDCKTHLDPGAFYADAGRPGGRSNRCKSCEKLRQARRTKTVREGRRVIIQRAKSRPCADCGSEHPYYVMDFDHREGVEKHFNLSNWSNFPMSRILEEIDKCDVVCANCHRGRSYRRATTRGEDPVELGGSE